MCGVEGGGGQSKDHEVRMLRTVKILELPWGAFSSCENHKAQTWVLMALILLLPGTLTAVAVTHHPTASSQQRATY